MATLATPGVSEAGDSLISRIDPPSKAVRALVALAIGAIAFAIWTGGPPKESDFAQLWYGVRALLHGVSPYTVVGPGRAFGWRWPLLYPLPAVVAITPLALLSLRDATGVFVAVGVAAFTYALTRDGWRILPVIASSPVVFAARTAQWSPLLSAAAVFPALGFLLVAKPTIGAAIWFYRPSRAAIAGGIALTVLSIAIQPSWITEWLTTLHSATHLVAPIAHSGGPLLVLALLKWRRPEARLLVALGCVPQTAAFYEAIPLMLLIPKTTFDSVTLTILSWVAFALWQQLRGGLLFDAQILLSAELIVLLLYLPCLVMVLRRPNEGDVPAWVERIIARSSCRPASR